MKLKVSVAMNVLLAVIIIALAIQNLELKLNQAHTKAAPPQEEEMFALDGELARIAAPGESRSWPPEFGYQLELPHPSWLPR